MSLIEVGVPTKEKSKWRFSSWGRTDLLYAEGQKRFFDPKSHAEQDVAFLRYKCPVFVFQDMRYVLNPRLADYHFQKVKDSFSAFQEVFQYISGVLGTNENPMVTISDKEKRDKKGFDNWSFKKRPK